MRIKKFIKSIKENPDKEIRRATNMLKRKEYLRNEVKSKRPVGMEYQDRYGYRKVGGSN